MSFNDVNDKSNFVVSFTHDPTQDFGVFARGYALAAHRLADCLLGAARFSDYEAYPVVFLYRHAFELSLKHIIYRSVILARLKSIDDIDSKLQNSHDLVELSKIATRMLAILFPRDHALKILGKEIMEIGQSWQDIDRRSDGYRYPINIKGQPSTKRHQVLNLRSLAAKMSTILEQLDTVHFGLNIETDNAEELYAIMQDFIPR